MLEINNEGSDVKQTPNFEVEIEGSYINQFYIELCISRFKEIIKSGESICNLNIVAKNEIKEVDILMVAYLLLFKIELPGLKVKIDFRSNSWKDVIIFKMRQYRAHAYVSSRIMAFNYICTDLDQDNPDEKYEEDIVWSEKFAPTLLINAENFQRLFLKSIESMFIPISDQVEFDSTNLKLYQKCREFLINNIKHDSDRSLDVLAQLAFYKSLNEAKILNFYLYSQLNSGLVLDNSETNLQAGKLQKANANQYYLSVVKFFERLEEMPPFFKFIYATILSSDLIDSELENKSIKRFQESIENLFDFTNELFIGIKELADNIVKHSSNHIGVISTRVFNDQMLNELKTADQNELSEIIGKYIQYTFEKSEGYKPSFLDINVIDNGELGIIESLKNKTSPNDPDYKTISERKIFFQNFLNPVSGLILNQQAKRATAHLGLLIFSNLIKSNNGIVRASTWASDIPKRDSYISIPTDLKLTTESTFTCEFGTNYSIIIPFNPTISLHKYLPSTTFTHPSEVSQLGVESIESLLSYQVYDLNDSANEYDSTNALFIIKPSIHEIISELDELILWNEIFQKVTKTIKSKKDRNSRDCFFCINLDTIDINPSQVFRLLGKWELAFPGYPIIIFNLFYEILSQLLDINKLFFESSNNQIPFWNLNSLALIYSYIENKNGRFYFADALWGNTVKDFMDVNLIIHKSNFNSIIIKNKKIESTVPSNSKSLNQFGLFHNNSNLLPLDLLLIGTRELSLFEHNAMILLQNELSTN